jgi:hypothetical protein
MVVGFGGYSYPFGKGDCSDRGDDVLGKKHGENGATAAIAGTTAHFNLSAMLVHNAFR